ncbi:peptidylprolyl isomerase [Clostridium sp. 2218st1_F5_2218SCRN_220325]|uniref:peptidylprolyl isomerase n=1 Tax=Clostridium sp. 2218st1_F5_2218SCRN_220325 TaxID=3143056 RepID=UPI002F421BE4
MKKTLYLGLVSLLCLSMIGCSSKNTFKVGDIEFSNQDVERVESILTATSNYTDANYLSDFKSSKDNKEITSKVIDYMIDNEVVYQKAQSEGIKVDENDVEQKYNQIKTMLDANGDYKKSLEKANIDEAYLKETIKKDLVINKYKEKYEEDLKVTDKEIETYYNKNKSDFKEESIEAYHILVSTLDDENKQVSDSEKDKLKSKANKIAEKIKSGEDFEKLAKENSDDKSTGKNGGYLGYFTKEDKNPEFTKKVFSLDKGQVSDVFETPYGYEIVKVTDKKTKQKSLEDCREDIVNRILAEKYLQHIEKLKDDTTIERN